MNDPDFDAWSRPAAPVEPPSPVIARFGRVNVARRADPIVFCPVCLDEPMTSVCRRKIIDGLPPLCPACRGDSENGGFCEACQAIAKGGPR